MARFFPTGVLPNLFPVWYSLCRVGIALIAVLIVTWMARFYTDELYRTGAVLCCHPERSEGSLAVSYTDPSLRSG
jgi:hypothetical protein